MRLKDVCDSFGRQLPELASKSEVLGCDNFAVSKNFFECGPFFNGDPLLRLHSSRDFPLLSRVVVLVAGSCAAADGSALLSKHNCNFLDDASVERYYKANSFCMFSIIRIQVEGKLTCPL